MNETNPAFSSLFPIPRKKGFPVEVSGRRALPQRFQILDSLKMVFPRHHVRIGDLNLARRFDRQRSTPTEEKPLSVEILAPVAHPFSVLRAILFSLDIICCDPEPSRNYPKKKETPCQASCGEKSNEWGGRLEKRVLLPFLENMFEKKLTSSLV